MFRTEFWAFIIAICLVSYNKSYVLSQSQLHREKRSFANMVEMMLIFLPRAPTVYNGYGNYCGYGGSGGCIDSIDDCCYTHDQCWRHIEEHFKCRNPINRPYRWTYTVQPKFDIFCLGTVCQKAICICDAKFVSCLWNQDSSFNPLATRQETTRACTRKWLFH